MSIIVIEMFTNYDKALISSGTDGRITKRFTNCLVVGTRWTVIGTEIDMMKIMTKLKTLRVTPHLPTLYNVTLTGRDVSIEMSDCGVPLGKVIQTLSSEDVFNISFQIVYTLYAITKLFPTFRHNDVHLNNILIRAHDPNSGPLPSFWYEVEGRMYKLSNMKYKAYLIDFGLSNIQNSIENMAVYDMQGDFNAVSHERNQCLDVFNFIRAINRNSDKMDPILRKPLGKIPPSNIRVSKNGSAFFKTDREYFTPLTFFTEGVFDKFAHSGGIPDPDRTFSAKNVDFHVCFSPLPEIPSSDIYLEELNEPLLRYICPSEETLESSRWFLDLCRKNVKIFPFMEEYFYRTCFDTLIYHQTKEKYVPFYCKTFAETNNLDPTTVLLLNVKMNIDVREYFESMGK